MSADWTNEQAILRDLAIAQGRVPVESVETVSCNDKPPSIHIEEETEESFIQQYAADGSTAAAPDFGLIQDMLELVRDVRVNDIENSDEDTKPKSEVKSEKTQKLTKVVNVKKNKNAATQSILNQQDTKETRNQPVLVVEPKSMFRPKNRQSVASTASNASTNESVGNESETKVSKPVFVPSSEAQEYYNRLVEMKRQKELREETIWTRAERQMREIEEKRRNKVSS